MSVILVESRVMELVQGWKDSGTLSKGVGPYSLGLRR